MNTNLEEYIELLQQLIAIPSFSREEEKTAQAVDKFFKDRSVQTQRFGNNIVVTNKFFDPSKASILLNSHHDTVKPNASWRRDPFTPEIEQNHLYGLGSNDAGGPLVALIAAFMHFFDMEGSKYNLVLAATAEEEVSGSEGVESILPELPEIELAIVGEPTQMQMAVAEKGLMVLDCTAIGKSGHAARNEGENAIYIATNDIDWFRSYQFDRVSEMLGPVKMSVTMINAGTQHNVVPDTCHFVVDVRSTDAYSNEEILEIIRQNVGCEVVPRSTRLQPSGLPKEHFLAACAEELGIKTFGSPTLSDQALLPFPSVKIGPGDSARSHTADEYIGLQEFSDGIDLYIKLLSKLLR